MKHLNNLSLKAVILGSLFSFSVNVAIADSKLENDPYVVLYQSRLDVERLDFQHAQTRTEIEKVRYEENQRLRREGDISELNLRKSRAQLEKTNLDIKRQELQMKEFELMLELVKFIRSAGREVPLFP